MDIPNEFPSFGNAENLYQFLKLHWFNLGGKNRQEKRPHKKEIREFSRKKPMLNVKIRGYKETNNYLIEPMISYLVMIWCLPLPKSTSTA